jgi:hypothetical protein
VLKRKRKTKQEKQKKKGGGKKSRTLRARSLEDKRSQHRIKDLEAL